MQAPTYCPSCKSVDIIKDSTGNGGDLYVAEYTEEWTECFDSPISMFKCIACKFTFYTGEQL